MRLRSVLRNSTAITVFVDWVGTVPRPVNPVLIPNKVGLQQWVQRLSRTSPAPVLDRMGMFNASGVLVACLLQVHVPAVQGAVGSAALRRLRLHPAQSRSQLGCRRLLDPARARPRPVRPVPMGHVRAARLQRDGHELGALLDGGAWCVCVCVCVCVRASGTRSLAPPELFRRKSPDSTLETGVVCLHMSSEHRTLILECDG